MRDIKALRNLQFVLTRFFVAFVANPRHVSHENLPQMLGYSNGKTQTPFILLAGGMYSTFLRLRWLVDLEIVQNRALDLVMQSVLTTRSLVDCASLILRTVSIIMGYVRHLYR